MAVTTSLFVSNLILLHPQLQMAPGSYLKPTGPPFLNKASSDLVQNYSNDLEDPIEHFTDILTNIANSTIPKSKQRSKKRDPVWLNDECMNSIRSRRKATRKVKTCPTPANIENLRIIQNLIQIAEKLKSLE